MNFKTEWLPDEMIFSSCLKGKISDITIDQWQKSIEDTEMLIPSRQSIKCIFNLYGYEPCNMEVHKKFRDTIPLFLSRHDFLAGYLKLYPELNIPLSTLKGIRCVAVAHVHHDQAKMSGYQQRFAKNNEAFFSNEKEADDWIKSF